MMAVELTARAARRPRAARRQSPEHAGRLRAFRRQTAAKAHFPFF
jgi:hypothetical protein